MDMYCKSISEIRSLLDSGEITCEKLTNGILKKIEKNNENYSALNHRALEIAEEVDKNRKENQQGNFLSGIPIVVDDSISTMCILTQNNSKILEGYIPVFDAGVIEKLYKEDVILIGKANRGEFGIGSEGKLYCTAKAIAHGEAIFGIALDTSGEVRLGSANHGLFGFRPTYGGISRYGVLAHSSSMDQLGIIAKNVEDLVLILNTVMDKDDKDSASIAIERIDIEKIKSQSIEDLKIGVAVEYFEGLDEEVKKELGKVIESMEKLGVKIDYINIPSLVYGKAAYDIISSGEFSSNAARYDGISYGYRAKDYKDVDELYKKTRTEGFGLEVKEKILFGNYVISEGQYEDYYEKAQKLRSKLQGEFQNVFIDFDLVLTPLDKDSTLGSNLAGLPSMSIPCRAHMEKPIGFQIIGPKLGEENILKLGYNYEKRVLAVGGGK